MIKIDSPLCLQITNKRQTIYRKTRKLLFSCKTWKIEHEMNFNLQKKHQVLRPLNHTFAWSSFRLLLYKVWHQGYKEEEDCCIDLRLSDLSIYFLMMLVGFRIKLVCWFLQTSREDPFSTWRCKRCLCARGGRRRAARRPSRGTACDAPARCGPAARPGRRTSARSGRISLRLRK